MRARRLAASAGLCLFLPGLAFAFDSIHILGSFNGWDESLWTSDPGMTRVAASVWADTVGIFPLQVQQGYQAMKFVTDRAWDSPPDYVLCPDRLDEYAALTGPVCPIPNGLDIVMLATTPGYYETTLDETALLYEARLVAPFTGRITGRLEFLAGNAARGVLPVADVQTYRTGAGSDLLVAVDRSSKVDGAFAVDSLAGGSYFLVIRALGYVEEVVPGLSLADGGSTDAGTVRLTPGCTTRWSLVQVVGDFNGWNESTPGMTQVESCIWEDTLSVEAGCYYMKFRTDGAWGLDYGTCTGQDPNCGVPLSGDTCLVDGESALGKFEIPSTGNWIFRLDEAQSRYAIQPAPTAVLPLTWSRVKGVYR